MATLTEIKQAGKGAVSTFTDDTTPVGHFAVSVKVLSFYMVYLLEGEEGNLNAVIKGRIEDRGPGEAARVYVGSDVKGGSWVGRFESTEKAFAAMV